MDDRDSGDTASELDKTRATAGPDGTLTRMYRERNRRVLPYGGVMHNASGTREGDYRASDPYFPRPVAGPGRWHRPTERGELGPGILGAVLLGSSGLALHCWRSGAEATFTVFWMGVAAWSGMNLLLMDQGGASRDTADEDSPTPGEGDEE